MDYIVIKKKERNGEDKMKELIIGEEYNEKLYIGISMKERYFCIMMKGLIFNIRKLDYIYVELVLGGRIIISKVI